MTKAEALGVLAILKATYPNSYKDMGDEMLSATASVWQKVFEDLPADHVSKAIMAFIANDTKGFAPAPGQIREYLYRLENQWEMTETEAWSVVKKACDYYDASKNFKELPENLQRLVGSASQLKAWAIMDAQELETVVGSNFMRSYRARTQSEKEHQKLPEAIKNFAALVSGSIPQIEGEK
jgi:hypothetical protein